ncbi:esterase-like activity of phytase family protein [Acuticoccus kandeliae]|uniref:esterase-like activity of phytase family protein n=1 Tax=Acuticoccus kandeliae TaxID=2073160 RepID=UPI000D3ED3DA|nr:esterase-like activity of phytase family protein [Acuticoccus kandeliae]
MTRPHRSLGRRSRRAALCGALALTLGALTLAESTHAEPIDLRWRTIDRFRIGEDPADRLRFLGGISLFGPRHFGGLSGLLVDGDRFLAVSDVGQWFSGRFLEEDGRLTGVADTELWPRRDHNGDEIRTKRAGDAEALTLVPGGVRTVVEGAAQHLVYPADGLVIDRDARPRRIDVHATITSLAKRHGVESLATLPTGEVIMILEGNTRTGDVIPAFRDGARFSIARRGEWSITGADALPGGDLVIVERYYGGGIDVRMRVRRLGADAVAKAGEGTVVDGPILLEADFSEEIDNMEAIAAQVRDGRIELTLMSDDNLSFLQRSLLLRFAIGDPTPRANPLRVASAKPATRA